MNKWISKTVNKQLLMAMFRDGLKYFGQTPKN